MRLMKACRVATVALTLTASMHSGSVEQQMPTFRSETSVVTVNLSVMKGRQPVTGLTTSDFELTDNGVPQKIDDALLEHVPMDVTLLITTFPLDRTSEHDRGLISADAARKLLLPEDRLRLVMVDDEVAGRLVDRDYDMKDDPTLSTWGRGVALSGGFRASNSAFTKSGFGVSLADGLFYALAWPVAPDRRHLVIAFTDGGDSASTLEMNVLPRLAGHSDAVLHAVLWSAPFDGGSSAGVNSFGTSGRRQWQADFHAMDESVQRTGGTLQRTGKAADALAGIIADFRSSYLLRYTPRNVAPAGWHELKVKVTRPGSFTIRARRGYEGS